MTHTAIYNNTQQRTKQSSYDQNNLETSVHCKTKGV